MRCWSWMACGLVLAPGAAWADQVVPADGVRTVEIHVATGDVKVEPSDSSDVIVTRGEVHVDRTDLRVVLKASRGSVSVKVPNVWLDVNAHSGDVTVRGTYGRVGVHTASGDVRVDGQADEIEVKSLAGDVRLTGRAKEVRVDCVSGNGVVDLDGAEIVRVRVTNGDVRVSADTLAKRVEVDSVNGDTDIRGGLSKGGVVRARTMSGRIRFERTNDVGYRVEARARHGRVDLGGKRQKSDEMVVDVVGDGAADVRLTAFSGRIEVE